MTTSSSSDGGPASEDGDVTTPIHTRTSRSPRRRAVVLAAVTAALLASAPAATATTRAQAERFAQRAAAHHTKTNFGIHYRAHAWDVDCERRGRGRWSCGVTSDGGQCCGSLRLRDRGGGGFAAYGHKIGCRE